MQFALSDTLATTRASIRAMRNGARIRASSAGVILFIYSYRYFGCFTVTPPFLTVLRRLLLYAGFMSRDFFSKTSVRAICKIAEAGRGMFSILMADARSGIPRGRFGCQQRLVRRQARERRKAGARIDQREHRLERCPHGRRNGKIIAVIGDARPTTLSPVIPLVISRCISARARAR